MKSLLIVAGLTVAVFAFLYIAARGRRTREAEMKATQSQSKSGSPTPRPDLAAVIRGCAALMEKTEPLTFYDEKTLPCAKDLAEKSVLAAIRLSPAGQHVQLFVMLEWLSQFQVGVGEEPAGLMVSNLEEKLAAQKAGTLSTEALMRELAGMGEGSSAKARWDALNQKAESDRARYLALYKAATSGL